MGLMAGVLTVPSRRGEVVMDGIRKELLPLPVRASGENESVECCHGLVCQTHRELVERYCVTVL